MPKETFNDIVGDNTLVVKWGLWGTVEIASETNQDFPYPFADADDPAPETMRGWYLSLSKEELMRLIKVLTRAARQYDSIDERQQIEAEPVEVAVRETDGEISGIVTNG